jgi:hypothetical protein
MNEFERRLRQLVSPFRARLSQWWGSPAGPGGTKRIDGASARARDLRDSETARKAAARLSELRDSDAARRAAAKLSDLRETDAARKAEAKLSDLRETDAARKAEARLADLRQREPVRKAEESARKALHDLFPGGKGGAGRGQA